MTRIFTYIIGLVLTSAMLTEYFLYSQNTLIQNNQWIAGKRMLKMVSMGADEFLLERSALAKNRVDLGRYFGFQEIYTRKRIDPTKITFDFLIKKDSYLDAYIINETGMRKGVRIKPDNSESLFFRRDPLNRALGQQVFKSNVSSNSWHKAELLFNSETISGQIGNVEFEIPIDSIELGNFGLQSGMNGALVDNIQIEDMDGVAFTEDFRRSTQWNTIFANFLGIIFLLFETILGLIFLLYCLLRKSGRPVLRNFLIYQTLTCCVLLFLFDYQFWSGRQYFNQTKMLKDGTEVSTIFLERWRFDGLNYLAHHFLLNKDPQEILENLNYPIERIYKGPIACSVNRSGCESYQKPEDALAQFQEKKIAPELFFLELHKQLGLAPATFKTHFL